MVGFRISPIPAEYDFLGTDVDNGKAGVIVEVQFSNYPFLLNNTVRSELFFKDRIPLSGQPTEVVIIITKAHMFPASNSTLYYEQAQKQLKALAESRLYNVPIRLVGLFERKSAIASVKFTEYESVRHSRKVVSRIDRNYLISPGRYAKSRCRLELSDQLRLSILERCQIKAESFSLTRFVFFAPPFNLWSIGRSSLRKSAAYAASS